MGKKFVGLDGLKHFWTKAKTWITGQITAEVTAKIAEIVANAPEDLDTLKEIADWISAHVNDAAAMNTQINTNKNNIAALQTSVAGKAAASHTHDNRYFTETEVTNKLAGKSDTGHTHTKAQITDFPTSLPANGGNADTVDGYHSSDLWRSDGAIWRPGANVTMTPNGNGNEWSFDFRNKNGATGSFFHVWDEDKGVLFKVDADSGNVYAPYGFVGNLTGTAGRAYDGTFGMLGGAKQAVSVNFEDLLNNELGSNQSGGLRGGSINVFAGQEAKNLGIPVNMWYNFLYIPHRTGISSPGNDNHMHGTLFVTPMTSNNGTFYIIHRINGHNYTAYRFNSAA